MDIELGFRIDIHREQLISRPRQAIKVIYILARWGFKNSAVLPLSNPGDFVQMPHIFKQINYSNFALAQNTYIYFSMI